MSNFIELTLKYSGEKMIVNTDKISIAEEVNGDVAVVIDKGQFVIKETYDDLKNLLCVTTEKDFRHLKGAKGHCKGDHIEYAKGDHIEYTTETPIEGLIDLVEDVEDFIDNPVSGSLNALADLAESLGGDS